MMSNHQIIYPSLFAAEEVIRGMVLDEQDMVQSARSEKGRAAHKNAALGLEKALRVIERVDADPPAIALLQLLLESLPHDHGDVPGVRRSLAVLRTESLPPIGGNPDERHEYTRSKIGTACEACGFGRNHPWHA
jgi:hypothetical protein